jgi:hypothetical protein
MRSPDTIACEEIVDEVFFPKLRTEEAVAEAIVDGAKADEASILEGASDDQLGKEVLQVESNGGFQTAEQKKAAQKSAKKGMKKKSKPSSSSTYNWHGTE